MAEKQNFLKRKVSTFGGGDETRGSKKRKTEEAFLPDDILAVKNNLKKQAAIQRRKANNNDKFLKLTDEIMNYFMASQQTVAILEAKRNIRSKLFDLIKTSFPGAKLFMFGSTLNGTGSITSDLDLCLLLDDPRTKNREAIIKLLYRISWLLVGSNITSRYEIIRATVPIIKFRDRIHGIECDINVNMPDGVRNTHLLRAYSSVDPRVRPLVMYVKRWARFNQINDAKFGTLTSYSLCLMLLSYLQCTCYPPVLPSLQLEHEEMFSGERVLTLLDLGEKPPAYETSNTQSVGELFAGFIDHYAKLRFESVFISVRLGKVQKRSEATMAEPSSQWKFIAIEEPYNLNNTARSVFNAQMFKKIQQAFQQTSQLLSATGFVDPSLPHFR